MDSESDVQNRLEKDLLSISIFFAIVAFVLSGIYYLSRWGFSNPLEPILKTLSIILFLLFIPFFSQVIVTKILKKLVVKEKWLSFIPVILYGFLSLLIAGLITQIFGFNLYPIIALIGFIAFLTGVFAWCKQGSWKHKLFLIILAGFFAVWVAGILWGGRYLKPLFEENLSVGIGEGTLDTLYLSTTSQMIATYNIPSTGLDGIPYLKYHYGSQWIFAQISSLLGISPLQFYQLGYPIIFVPFTYFCMLTFVLYLRQKLNPLVVKKPVQIDYNFWLIFIGANIGVLPLQIQRTTAIHNGRQLYSESNGVALEILFLLFLIILFAIKTSEKIRVYNKNTWFVFLIILPIFTAVLGFIKISFAAIILVLAGYFFLRLKLYQRFFFWVSLGETITAFLIAFILVSKPMPSGFSPLNFIRANVTDWEAFWFLVYFFWSWLFIISWLKKQNITNLQEFKCAFIKHDTVLVEIVVVVVIAGLLPGIFINLGGNAWYFSDIQKWIALSFLLAILCDHEWTKKPFINFSPTKFWQIRFVDVFVLFFSLTLIGSILLNFTQTTSKMVIANLITRAAIHQQINLSEVTYPSITEWPQLFLNNQADLEKTNGFAMINTLKSLSNLPHIEKRNSLLFIPQTNRRYWDLMQYCISSPFVATSLSGIAMLDGLPDKNCNVDDFGYWAYNLRAEPQSLSLQKPSELCDRAKLLGFTKVISVDTTAEAQIEINKISCH
jgi:hypothetical protein